ncbi:MAG: YfdX family protein [Methylococcales bacterium]
MKKQKNNITMSLGSAAIPLFVSLSLLTLSAEAANDTAIGIDTATATGTPAFDIYQTKQINKVKNKLNRSIHKQVIKEAADAFKATATALKALQNDQPKQALAALEIVSGNLHLLLERDPSLGLIPIEKQVEVIDGVKNLKTIKQLESELEDLIDDGKYQTARPIVDSLVDELRVTTVYLPLATYPSAIDRIGPLIDAGQINEAKSQLIEILNTYVSDQEVTPLAILQAEGDLTEAFQIEREGDIAKQETKDKVNKLVIAARQNIKVAEALGYGTKDNYEVLYNSIDALTEAIRNASIKNEWIEIKKSLSVFKNKIVHPRG